MKKRILAMLLAVVLSAGLLPGPAFAAAPDVGSAEELSVLSGSEFDISVTGTRAYAYAYEVAEQVNQLRAGLGLKPLTVDPELMETAMRRAAECSVYFSHTRPNGTRCFTIFPDRGNSYFAENIAAGQSTPTSVMNAWINSSGHYRNMTSSSSNAIGVGCFCADGRYYWTQCFTGGPNSSVSTRLSDQTVTESFPVDGENFSPAAGTGTVSLRMGQSCQLPVYNRNKEFYGTSVTLSGVPEAMLYSGMDLVRLDSGTLTITGAAVGSGTVILSLPDGTALSFDVQVEERFTDVLPRDYFYAAVAWAVENGVTVGTGDDRFTPKKTCSEVEILTMLHRAAGTPPAEDSPIPVLGYYQNAVNWAYWNGMIDGSFDPDAGCTRARAVKFIWQAFGSQPAPAKGFSDVPEEYAAAVAWAVDNGITLGAGNGKFEPERTCMREEIVTFLHRAYVPEFRMYA